jgi:hypothetical protein
MMTERQRKFRAQYMAAVSKWYNGLVHVGVMYAAGIGAIWWCVSHMQNATWEWLLIVPVAIAGNFGEWAMHKFVMHRLRDVYAMRAIYDRHTRQHHQYFTDNDPTIHTIRNSASCSSLARADRAGDRRRASWAHRAADQRQRRLRRRSSR